MPRNSCSWNLAGTKTFRLSSSKLLGRWGTNLQNPDKETCPIYRPDPGKKFVQADQSGAEALVVSYLCRKGKFRELFLHGIKPHVFVGLHLFKDVWRTELKDLDLTPYLEASPAELASLPKFKELDKLIKSSDKWPSQRRFYYMAKQVCHSANYDIQAMEFAVNVLKNSSGTINLGHVVAGKFLLTYHTLFPEIREWHQKVRTQVKIFKSVSNLFGFKRHIHGFLTDRDYKQIYAWIPQSTVGTITNIALTNLQYYIEDNNLDWDILNNKHDSYLVQAPIEEAEECGRVMQKFMEQSLTAPDGTTFTMRSEVASGFNWGDLH